MAEPSDEVGAAPNMDSDPEAEESAPVTDPRVTATEGPLTDPPDGPADPSGGPSAQNPAEGAHPDPPPVGPSPDGVAAAVEDLEEQVRGFHVRAESYEQTIRQMQSRIEQLQGDQVQALLRPVIRRFAGLHSQAAEAAERARERGEKSEKDFDFFMDTIEEALGLIDVESVEAEPFAEFDPGKHHAARAVTTDAPEMDRRIHRVLRQGFTYVDADRVFLPAQVSVYRHQESR